MNAKALLSSLVIASLFGVSLGQAAPIGTAKARGDFRSFSQAQHARSSRPVHRYGAPIVTVAPSQRQAASAPQVVQAPGEVRYFTSTPSVGTDQPCPQLLDSAAVGPVDTEHRRSPAPAASAPVIGSSREFCSRSTYAPGSNGRGNVNLWSLPKTDARKYNSR